MAHTLPGNKSLLILFQDVDQMIQSETAKTRYGDVEITLCETAQLQLPVRNMEIMSCAALSIQCQVSHNECDKRLDLLTLSQLWSKGPGNQIFIQVA